MTPFNILHIVNMLNVQGVSTLLLSVINNYDRSVLSPTVCSLMDHEQMRPEFEAEGVDVFVMGMPSQRNIILPDWRVLRSLMRIIRQRDIDIVHMHGYFPSLYGRYAAYAHGSAVHRILRA